MAALAGRASLWGCFRDKKVLRCVGNQLGIRKSQQCPALSSDMLFIGELISPLHKPVPPSSRPVPSQQPAEITLGVSNTEILKTQPPFKVMLCLWDRSYHSYSFELCHSGNTMPDHTPALSSLLLVMIGISYFSFSFISYLSKIGNHRLFYLLVIYFVAKTGPSTGLDIILVNFSLHLNIVSLIMVAYWYFSSNMYNTFSFNKLFNSWHHSSFASVLCVVLHGSLVWNYLQRKIKEE